MLHIYINPNKTPIVLFLRQIKSYTFKCATINPILSLHLCQNKAPLNVSNIS